MEDIREQAYMDILQNELVPALGCTEPIAVAYACAKAARVLGVFPEHIDVCCSGNIIKNVKGVMVPNSGGLRGIAAAAVLGVVGGDADSELEVLEHVRPEDIEKTRRLLEEDFFSCKLQENVENLYIVATATAGGHNASVTIINRHTLITQITRDGEVLYHNSALHHSQDKKIIWELTVADILEFAKEVDIQKLRPLLLPQIELNTAIARAGLEQRYGAQVGCTLLESYGDDVRTRARAMAAAGSDARMGGCSYPVVINSGSGNQGITVSLPVLEYAREWQVAEETCYRALAISNLVSIHLKHYIGSLSAFCGAVTAAAGASAAITYMAGGSSRQIFNSIINTLGNVGGIVCDGAKSSCAAKIATAVDAAILAHSMSMRERVFQPGEGLVQQDLESTIRSVCYVGREGMRKTDLDILNIMIDNLKP